MHVKINYVIAKTEPLRQPAKRLCCASLVRNKDGEAGEKNGVNNKQWPWISEKKSSVDQALYVCVEGAYAGAAVCMCQCAWTCICVNVHADKHHIIKAHHPYHPEINPLLSDDLLSIQLIFITFSVSFSPPHSSISSSLFLFYQEKQLRFKISVLINAINCLILNGITALLVFTFSFLRLSLIKYTSTYYYYIKKMCAFMCM